MEYRVKIMPRAERDLAGIYDWIGALSSEAALTWYHGLRDAIRTLRNTPNRCPVTPEIVTSGICSTAASRMSTG
jgi:plasmid stabilization system protein ParE